jgi:hypothetical protein
MSWLEPCQLNRLLRGRKKPPVKVTHQEWLFGREFNSFFIYDELPAVLSSLPFSFHCHQFTEAQTNLLFRGTGIGLIQDIRNAGEVVEESRLEAIRVLNLLSKF